MILSRVNLQSKDSSSEDERSKKNKDQVPSFEEFIKQRDYTGALTLIDYNTRSPSAEKELWRAFCYFRLADYKKAIEVYKRIRPDGKVEVTAEDVNLFLDCCRFYLGQKLDETTVNAYTGRHQALARRIGVYLQFKETPESDASKEIESIQTKLSKSIEDDLYIAALYFSRNQFQESIDIYKKILLDKKNYLALNVYIALCYYRLDYYDVSQEMLALYTQKHADSIMAGNLKACNNYRLYNGTAAETELRNLIESFPPNFAHAKDLIRHNLVVFRSGEGAFQVLPLLLNSIPEARLNLIIFHLKNDRLDEAQALVRDIEPKLPIEHILTAIVDAILGQAKPVATGKEAIKSAQNYYQLVGSSPTECDTIQGRQCMASYFFLAKQFEDVVLYLSSIKSYFYNDDTFNFNYAQAKLATRSFAEAEEAFLLIESERLKTDMIYICGLVRCYIVNGRSNKAWEMYLKYQHTKEASMLLHLIANDAYKIGAFLVALKAFDQLEKMDSKSADYWEGKRGAAAGVFQLVYARQEPIENVMEAMKLLRNSSNAQANQMINIMKNWIKTEATSSEG